MSIKFSSYQRHNKFSLDFLFNRLKKLLSLRRQPKPSKHRDE